MEPEDDDAECDGTGNAGDITAWLNSFSGSDVCSGAATVTNNYGTEVTLSDGCGATGSVTVTFTLTDACGNDITADATFTIHDNTDPTWTVEPEDDDAECDGTGNAGDIDTWLNSFSGSDVCSGAATVTNNYGTEVTLSDGCGATGSVTVTFTLTDACGNDITADATFTIHDNTDPTWTVEPEDDDAECDGTGNAGDIDTWLNSFSGSDVCSGAATVTNNYGTEVTLSDGCGATGSVTVTFTLTDACGNDITADATFTIHDNTDPTWTVEPEDDDAECDGTGNAGDIDTWLNSFSGSDVCSGAATVTNNYGTEVTLSDGCGATGSVTVTFTLTDACGNDITADATFTIHDNTDPTWTVEPEDDDAECDGTGNAGDIDTWLNSFSGSDVCSGAATVTNNYGKVGR